MSSRILLPPAADRRARRRPGSGASPAGSGRSTTEGSLGGPEGGWLGGSLGAWGFPEPAASEGGVSSAPYPAPHSGAGCGGANVLNELIFDRTAAS